MKFVIIGSGNIGCLYGANLARVGADVTMLDIWEEHIQQINEQGLQMSGLHGDVIVNVAVTTDVEALPDADVALICVNTNRTKEAAKIAAACLIPSGYAITLQNGLGNIETLMAVPTLGEPSPSLPARFSWDSSWLRF